MIESVSRSGGVRLGLSVLVLAALLLTLLVGSSAATTPRALVPALLPPVTAFVVNAGDDSVTPIAVATNTAGSPITVGTAPDGVAITRDGKTAYVTNEGDGTVTPIAVATNTAGRPITLGGRLGAIAITPDGKTAYVTNEGDGTVTPIAVATNTAGSPITVGSFPLGVAVTPDGKTAYVTNEGDGTVTSIAVATNTAGSPITVGSLPTAIAITSAPNALAQLANLLSQVTGVGPGRSLADKINEVLGDLAANDYTDACRGLSSFLGLVAAQNGKKLTSTQAASFTAQTNTIKTALGC